MPNNKKTKKEDSIEIKFNFFKQIKIFLLMSYKIKNKYNDIKNKIAINEVKAIYIPFVFIKLILKSNSNIINKTLKSPVRVANFLKKTMYFSIIILFTS